MIQTLKLASAAAGVLALGLGGTLVHAQVTRTAVAGPVRTASFNPFTLSSVPLKTVAPADPVPLVRSTLLPAAAAPAISPRLVRPPFRPPNRSAFRPPNRPGTFG